MSSIYFPLLVESGELHIFSMCNFENFLKSCWHWVPYYGTQWYAIIGTKKKHPSMRQTCELLDAWLMGGCNLLFIIWKSISLWLNRRKSQRQSTWCLTDGVRPQLWRSSWGKAATLNKRLSGRSGFWRLGDILRETLRLGSCLKPKRHRS